MNSQDEDEMFIDYDPYSSVNKSKIFRDNKLCKKEYYLTFILCMAFLGLGACIALPGPTLHILSNNINSTKAVTSWIFTARSLGYLFGSIIGGILFDHMNQMMLLAVSIFLSAVATGLTPLCDKLFKLAIAILLQGVCMGFLDSGGNVVCLNAWTTNSGPALQSLHFSFGLGAFIGPLIVKAFFEKSEAAILFPSNLTTSNNSSKLLNSYSASYFVSSVNDENSHMFMPVTNAIPKCTVSCSFFIISVFLIFVSLFFFILFFCSAKKFPHTNASIKLPEDSHKNNFKHMGSYKFKILMLFLLSFFFFCYVGTEVAFGGLISSFAMDRLKFTEQKAALVASVFWGAFTVGRFISIFLSSCLKPSTLIFMDLFISITAIILLVIFENVFQSQNDWEHYILIFWLSSGLFGFGMASIFPSGISWVDNYIDITAKSASVFVVGSALGEMIFPMLSAQIMFTKITYFLDFLLAIIIFCLVLFFTMFGITLRRKKKEFLYEKASTNEQLLLKETSISHKLELDYDSPNFDSDISRSDIQPLITKFININIEPTEPLKVKSIDKSGSQPMILKNDKVWQNKNNRHVTFNLSSGNGEQFQKDINTTDMSIHSDDSTNNMNGYNKKGNFENE